MVTSLQNVRPDFDEIVTTLGNLLKGKESWKDLFEGATGQTLIEFLAAVGVYGEHSIESLFLETFLETARRDTSVYAIARMLGVRIGRKLSPQVPVRISRLTAGSPLVIPAFTSFTSSNSTLVNFTPIVFEVGQLDVIVPLFIGTLNRVEFFSDGTNFQEITVQGSGPFTVSDQHVEVRVNNTIWRPVTNGLWNYTSADRVVSDTTSRDGDLVLLFGDDKYGVAPNLGEVIRVTWIDTLGNSSEQIISGTKVTVPISGLTAVTTGTFSNGANEKDPEFYRIMAPHISNERDKPVTTEGYTAKALEYPGVVDCKIIPQRDLNQYDLRLMNVIHVSLLIDDGSVWTTEVEPPAAPTFLTIDGAGNLGPANYGYKITSVNEVGESDPSSEGTYALLTPGAILVRWQTVLNAKSYRIYGRASGGPWEYITEVVPTAEEQIEGIVKFVDDGTTFPNGTIPSVNNTLASWWTFQTWFEKYKHASVRLVQMTPVAIPVDLEIQLYVRPSVDSLDSIRASAYTRLVELFAPRLGSIGRKVMRSDIVTACKVPKEEDPLNTDVDYVVILKPEEDVIPEGMVDYLYIRSIAITCAYTDRRERFE